MHTLEKLCEQFSLAKSIEAEATEHRIGIEQEIIKMVGLPEEGSKTHDAGPFKVRVEQKINRKIDPMAWASIKSQIPEELRPVKVEEILKVENKGVLWLKEHEKGYYTLLCSAMEEKPAKPSVKVEVA